MTRTTSVLFAVAVMLLGGTLHVSAAVPSYINYQGILTNGSGNPIVTTTSVVFTIYDAATLGSTLWTETRNVTPDADGRFSIILGQATPITDIVFETPPCWLGTKVGADLELTPRSLLSSVPYTYRVATLDGATGGDVSGEINILTDGSGGGAGVRDPGGDEGSLTSTAAIFTNPDASRTVSYGIDGITILIDNTVLKDALNDTIFHVDANDTTMTLGSLSRATAQGGVALGDSCLSEADYATIAGGIRNIIRPEGTGGFIGGGLQNVIEGPISEAPCAYAAIGGGFSNWASQYATVAGGANNEAVGSYSMTPGGYLNSAGGDYSFAAGRQAKSNHHGSFVWADNTVADFTSTANNQFLLRASGGVGVNTNAPPSQLCVYHAESPDQTSLTQDLGRGGLTIVSEYTHNHFTPGVFWSTADNNPTNPKAGIYLRETSLGTEMIIGTSNNYAVGITNDALIIDKDGDLFVEGCVTADNLACPSDERFKRDIETIRNALSEVQKLRGARYHWRTDQFPERKFPEGEQVGLIAQEVAKVVPQAVVEQNDGYLAVDYARLVPLLIEAVKQQQKQIDEQKEEIQELKGKFAQ